jgi:hypothetical protein
MPYALKTYLRRDLRPLLGRAGRRARQGAKSVSEQVTSPTSGGVKLERDQDARCWFGAAVTAFSSACLSVTKHKLRR